jgi:hypothetical protein
LSSPIYAAVYLAIVSVIFLVSSSIAGRPLEFVEMFREGTFYTIGSYMVIQTIFFLGACGFKNHNFIKTLFSLFVIAFGLGLFAAIIGGILFNGLEGKFDGGNDVGEDFKEMAETVFTEIIPFIFWYILGPFLLIVSYFKLKERQA